MKNVLVLTLMTLFPILSPGKTIKEQFQDYLANPDHAVLLEFSGVKVDSAFHDYKADKVVFKDATGETKHPALKSPNYLPPHANQCHLKQILAIREAVARLSHYNLSGIRVQVRMNDRSGSLMDKRGKHITLLYDTYGGFLGPTCQIIDADDIKLKLTSLNPPPREDNAVYAEILE